jgi:hypothetical protein
MPQDNFVGGRDGGKYKLRLGLGDCITVIWPNHTWMHEHGWGESDPDCVRAFQSIAAHMDVCDSSTLHVAVLDSMFTQAHLLG